MSQASSIRRIIFAVLATLALALGQGVKFASAVRNGRDDYGYGERLYGRHRPERDRYDSKFVHRFGGEFNDEIGRLIRIHKFAERHLQRHV